MHMFINALILAVLVPASEVQRAEDGPACRAELKGLDLLTILELPSGVKVEGPWRVLHSADVVDDVAAFVMYATLDRVIERNPVTGARSIVPFPKPVSLAFEGATQAELVQRAAQVWCLTVMRAHERKLETLSPQETLNTRVAVAPIGPTNS